jgi:hypothetical protein
VGGVVDLYQGLMRNDQAQVVHAYETWGFKGLRKDLIEVLNIWARFIYGPLLDDRVRTIADMISTGMIESPAESFDDIIAEVAAARVTERGSRADDKASEAAMEDRKKAGYF